MTDANTAGQRERSSALTAEGCACRLPEEIEPAAIANRVITNANASHAAAKDQD